MRFVDEVRIVVVAGDGGDGAVAFRREKFVPFGGPSGGDGGNGGDVVMVGDEGLSTLLDQTYFRTIKAERGRNGEGKDKYGRAGRPKLIRVPVGTQVWDEKRATKLGDLTEHEQRLVVARGGRGGRGNIHFATPVNRAPRKAEQGRPGEQRPLRLELKLLADVGLLGFPNVGKSTFVAAVSAARPKVADYPFTTLIPSLGVVDVAGGPARGGSRFVVADIPGLIRGASEGAGLGLRFLKHLERTRALLHLVTLEHEEDREPVADYRTLRKELERFDAKLAKRPEIVALSKADLPEVREAYPSLRERFAAQLGVELHLLSAVTGQGVQPVIQQLSRLLTPTPSEDPDIN